MQSFYFYQKPLLERSPATPCPDPILHPEWYGDIQLQWPTDSTSISLRFGPLVKANFAMRNILHDVANELYKAPHRGLSVQQAVRIRVWFEGVFLSLPEPLRAANIRLSDGIMLQ